MTGNWWRVFSFLLLSATAVEGSTFYMDNSTGSCTSSDKDMYMYSSSHTVKAWYPGKTQMFASYCYMVFDGYLNKLAMNFSSFSATSPINLRFDDFYGYSLKELLILDNSSSTPSSTYYTIGPYLRVNLTMSIPYSTGYSFEFNVWIYNGTSTTLGTRALPISMDNSQHCSPNFIYVNSGQYLWVTAWSPSNTYRSTTSSCTMYFRPANSVDIMAISFASGSLSISNSHVTLSFYDETGTSRDKLIASFNSYNSTPNSTYYCTSVFLTIYLSSGHRSSTSFSFQVFATPRPPTTATPSPANVSSGLSDGAIAGIVIGSVAAVVLLGIVIKVCSSAKKSSPRTRIRPHATPHIGGASLNTAASTVNYTTISGQMGMQNQQYGGFAPHGPAYFPPSQGFGPITPVDPAYPLPSHYFNPDSALPPSYMEATGGDGQYAPPPPPASYIYGSAFGQTNSGHTPGISDSG